MDNSHNDRDAQGASDEQQNKLDKGRSENENTSQQGIDSDPNHKKPENSWSPSNESERQMNESDGDRNFDRGGTGLNENDERDSSNSLYTEKGGNESREQQHAGTQTEHQDRDLSNENTWKTGSDEPAAGGKSQKAGEERQNETSYSVQGIGGNVGGNNLSEHENSAQIKKDKTESESPDEENSGH